MDWARRLLAVATLLSLVLTVSTATAQRRNKVELNSEQLVEVIYRTLHETKRKDPGMSREEMKDLKERLAKSWPHKEETMERWFLLADENSNDAVSLAEAKKLSDYLTRDLPRRCLAQLHQLPEAQKMIEGIAKSNGGGTPIPLTGFPVLRIPTKQIWEISRATLIDHDADKDGKLSGEEVAKNPQLASAAEQMDANKDKHLTDDEINTFLVNYATQQALNVASARFAAQMQQMFGCSH